MEVVLVILFAMMGTTFMALAHIYLWLLIRKAKAELRLMEDQEEVMGQVPILDYLYDQEV